MEVERWGRRFIRRDEHAERALVCRGSLLERPRKEVTGIVFLFTLDQKEPYLAVYQCHVAVTFTVVLLRSLFFGTTLPAGRFAPVWRCGIC